MDLRAKLDEARALVADRAWEQACARLSAIDETEPLTPDDLILLATCAYLIGHDAQSTAALERAHLEYLRTGALPQAARCAFWLVLFLQLRGESAPAAGWLARGRRLLEDHALDCVEQGYLLLPAGIRNAVTGDFAAAAAAFTQAVKIGERFADPDLLALARQSLGRARIGLGDVAEGMALLDEAMVAVVAGEISPVPAGVVYCATIEACHELFDLRRAEEWTAALTRWCEAGDEPAPFRGQCLVHRSQVMLRRGAWADAFDEVQRARDRLSRPAPHPALGLALYQRAELRRLRGEFAEAERDYRQANDIGHPPQPGLALLRLAQGRPDAALTSIRQAVDEATNRIARASVLGPLVEIALAAGELDDARAAADELSGIADELDSVLLRAVAGHARGAVLLADDDAGASAALAAACAAWAGLEAPYDHARCRMLLGLARQRLGDDDTAAMELDAARQAFRRLGAAPDLARLDTLTRRRPAVAVGGLSAREVQVLGLVAAGLTNRAIATELFLSEKTVARHLSNIFTKLGISSRAAATAFAYQHGLVGPDQVHG